MTPLRLLLRSLVLLFILTTISDVHAVRAQQPPRFGIAFNTMLSTADGLGLGLRGRVSSPMNKDLSFALDLGITGFVLAGRDDAVYVFDPQISAIVTLPSRGDQANYILGGLGAYIPFSDNPDKQDRDDAGPTIHLGMGRIQGLSETTIFYELVPTMVVGAKAIDIVLPLRLGVIF